MTMLSTWEYCEFKELLISLKLLDTKLKEVHFLRLCFEVFGAKSELYIYFFYVLQFKFVCYFYRKYYMLMKNFMGKNLRSM